MEASWRVCTALLQLQFFIATEPSHGNWLTGGGWESAHQVLETLARVIFSGRQQERNGKGSSWIAIVASRVPSKLSGVHGCASAPGSMVWAHLLMPGSLEGMLVASLRAKLHYLSLPVVKRWGPLAQGVVMLAKHLFAETSNNLVSCHCWSLVKIAKRPVYYYYIINNHFPLNVSLLIPCFLRVLLHFSYNMPAGTTKLIPPVALHGLSNLKAKWQWSQRRF